MDLVVEFCPRCRMLLRPQKEAEDRLALVCPRCGFKKELGKANGYVLSQDVKRSEKEKTLILEGNSSPRTLPRVKGLVTCPKCGHDEAYYWIMQTRRADEPPTRFYRCAKCGHVWREYE